MHDTLSAVQVFYSQTAELFTPDTVIQQGSQYGPIPDALERVRGWGFQQFAGLRVAECRGAAFVPVGHWPFHSVHRIAGDSVAFAEIMPDPSKFQRSSPISALKRPSDTSNFLPLPSTTRTRGSLTIMPSASSWIGASAPASAIWRILSRSRWRHTSNNTRV